MLRIKSYWERGEFTEHLTLLALTAIFLFVLYFMDPSVFLIALPAISAVFVTMFLLFELKDRKKQTVHLAKFLISLVPLIIIAYLAYMNLAPLLFDNELNFFMDVGGKNEEGSIGITSLKPLGRVSDKINHSHRIINHSLVYFGINVPENSEKLKIQIKFKGKFPVDIEEIFLAAKIGEGWNYSSKPIYIPEFNFSEAPFLEEGNTRLYALRKGGKNFTSIKDFIQSPPKNSLIVTEKGLEVKETELEGYIPENMEIHTSIRKSATFLIYAKEKLWMQVEKFDLNWYAGEDSLNVNIFDSKNNLITNISLPDDGNVKADRKIKTTQKSSLTINNLSEGVYKIHIKGTPDTIIKKIKLNQNKLVFKGPLILANSGIYNTSERPVTLYFKNRGKRRVYLVVSHIESLQNITINQNTTFELKSVGRFNLTLDGTGDFQTLITNKTDILVNPFGYYSFTEHSYFEPFEYETAGLDNLELVKENADYILTDYKEPVAEGGWLVAAAEFNASMVYKKDRKVNMILNARHLGQKNDTIAVDWINVTVYRKGIFGNS